MNRSAIIVIGVIAFLVIYLAIMATFTDNFSNKAESDRKIVTFMNEGDFHTLQSMEKLIKKFEKQNPDIEVKFHYTPGDYTRKLRIKVSAGLPPDIAVIWDRYINEYVYYGVLQPLDSFIDNPDPGLRVDRNLFRPITLKAFKADGKQMGIPTYEGTLMVYYNRKLFREAGLEYPESDWTYDEFINKYCRNLTRDTDGDGRIDQYAINPIYTYLYFSPFMINMGARITSDDGKEWLMDNPEGWRAWDEYGRLTWKYRACADFRNFIDMSWGATSFLVQRSAMLITGPWNLAQLLDLPKLEFDVVRPPRDRLHKTRLITGCMAMFKSCAHKDAAWKFLRFLTTDPEAQIVNLRSRIPPLLPVQQAILNDDYSFLKDPEEREEYAPYMKYLKKFIVPEEDLFFLNFGIKYEEMRRIMGYEMDDVWLGNIDGKGFMKRLVNRFIEAGMFPEQYKGRKVDRGLLAN